VNVSQTLCLSTGQGDRFEACYWHTVSPSASLLLGCHRTAAAGVTSAGWCVQQYPSCFVVQSLQALERCCAGLLLSYLIVCWLSRWFSHLGVNQNDAAYVMLLQPRLE
jgi:hypothetical protein